MKIGQIIKDRYEIEEILGEGGMAFVYKAKDRQLQRTVAIKTLKPKIISYVLILQKYEPCAVYASSGLL